MSDYRWSLGTILGLPLLALMAIAIVLGCWFAWRWVRSSKGDEYGEHGMAWCVFATAVVGLLATIVGTAWGMWPYKAEYHQWRTESGVVTQVDSRFIGEDRSTTQRFVVELDGDRQRSCDDTRCAQVEIGDVVTLQCKRAWQWSGTHGYDCNFISLKRGAA